jgi:hypothetical protein
MAAVLDAVGRLSKSLLGMSRALGTVPLTVKLRTGIKDGHNNAHKLMPRARLWGVSAMTLHGRTRQQRYSKLADWEYIGKCVEAVRAAEADEGRACPSRQPSSSRADAARRSPAHPDLRRRRRVLRGGLLVQGRRERRGRRDARARCAHQAVAVH